MNTKEDMLKNVATRQLAPIDFHIWRKKKFNGSQWCSTEERNSWWNKVIWCHSDFDA